MSNPFEDDRQPTEHEKVVSQILDVQQESKGSTQRSLALLYQTEEVGSATAEQLIEQGEKLDRIEENSRKIDSDLKESQKHINGLKSIFGGFTNWWQSKKEKKSKHNHHQPDSENESGLRSVVNKTGDYNAIQNRPPSRQPKPSSRMPTGGTTVEAIMEQHEQEIDDDLEQMGNLTERLKYMAVAMGEEMDKQNVQIENITDRVGKTDVTMSGQNRQMNKILGK